MRPITSMQAEERKRARWARELHDDTLQHLAALTLELTLVQRRVSEPDLKDRLQEAIDQATRQVEALRALITELRPADLDQLGLGAAVRELAARTREHAAFEVDLDLRQDRDGAAGRLDADVEVAIYRLAEEALTNVARHAHARRATVTLHANDSVVCLDVTDDGDGFDVDRPRAGFGVSCMYDRVALLGGTLNITSRPGSTAVHAVVPLPSSYSAQQNEEPRRA